MNHILTSVQYYGGTGLLNMSDILLHLMLLIQWVLADGFGLIDRVTLYVDYCWPLRKCNHLYSDFRVCRYKSTWIHSSIWCNFWVAWELQSRSCSAKYTSGSQYRSFVLLSRRAIWTNDTQLVGSAHIKTGLLDFVQSMAGYVTTATGNRYVVVLLHNDPRAHTRSAEKLQNQVINWIYKLE